MTKKPAPKKAAAKPLAQKRISKPKFPDLDAPTPDQGLTLREQMFVEHYVLTRNGTQSCIHAGYSEVGARVQARRLLTRANIRTAIFNATAELRSQQLYDSDTLFLSLVDDLEADVSDLFDEDGALLPAVEWPAPFRQGLVAGVTVTEIWEGTGKDRTQIGVMKTIKLADRARIKEMLGKHVRVQAFNEKRTLDIPADSPLAMLVAQIANTPLVPDEDGENK